MNAYPKIDLNVTKGALIGGSWVDGSAGTFEVRNPHDGSLLHEVGKCDAEDI